ncbi:MAG: hypothetical protein OET57_13465 [Desulfobacteraceae bacterium]|nr:hypothetical protein [Desulfobacteraceae bacterium]
MEHPTFNIERPTSNGMAFWAGIEYWSKNKGVRGKKDWSVGVVEYWEKTVLNHNSIIPINLFFRGFSGFLSSQLHAGGW